MKEKQYHLTYQVICKVNGKQYIGVHSTDVLDDGYLGSSNQLDKDIRLFGRINFVRTILEYHSTRQSALQQEKELVDAAWVNRPDTYNLSVGGSAYPYGHRIFSVEHRQKLSIANTLARTGTKHSKETKQKIGNANRGNSRPDVSERNTRLKKGSH